MQGGFKISRWGGELAKKNRNSRNLVTNGSFFLLIKIRAKEF